MPCVVILAYELQGKEFIYAFRKEKHKKWMEMEIFVSTLSLTVKKAKTKIRKNISVPKWKEKTSENAGVVEKTLRRRKQKRNRLARCVRYLTQPQLFINILIQ